MQHLELDDQLEHDWQAKAKKCSSAINSTPNLAQPFAIAPARHDKNTSNPISCRKDLANLQGTYKTAPELGGATSIIHTYGLASLITRYCHCDCETLSEDEKIKALSQLMSFAKDLSELERLEAPNYKSIGKFFELVEARNLIRMAAKIHHGQPLLGLEGAQLELAEDSESTLQRAEKIREWFGQNQADLSALNQLNLGHCRLTLLPPEIGQFGTLTKLWLPGNRLICLPKEIGQLRALTGLWLADNRLTSLPKEIGQLGALDYLDLSRNQLTSLPKEIGRLTALTTIIAEHNHLTSLPKEIGQLGALTVLWIYDNQLTSLPKEIGRLAALTDLKLNNNSLKSLPKEIGQLGALSELCLGDNRLTRLPEEIGQLGALTRLEVGNNRLINLPKEIGQLQGLRVLDLSHNRLTYLPKNIGLLRALGEFKLNNNHLISLPKEIGGLEALTWIWLEDNRLNNIPNEILQVRNLLIFVVRRNGLVDLPAGLERFSKELENQDKTLQMVTIVGRLKQCLKGKHDCRGILMLLETMEKLYGGETRSKLHGCIYEVCKEEKALHKKVKRSHFGRRAFVDPAINPKFKLAAIKLFEQLLKAEVIVQ